MIIKIFLFFYKIHYILILYQGAVVIMLVRKLDIQPHLHSVHTTTELHGEVFSLQHYVTCDMPVVFFGYSVSSTNITERHDIAESGVKHHKANPFISLWYDLY
jgi:hypothetical protein